MTFLLAERQRSQQRSIVKTRHLVGMMIAGLLLLVTGFAGGIAWTEFRLSEVQSAGQPIISTALLEKTAVPTSEVPGADVPGLPRFPGASRVEYRQVIDGDLLETEVEYVVANDLEVVHDFYRDVFDEQGWKVADLGVYQGEWTFFVISGEREALMEIESRGELIEIEIEITEPLGTIGTTPTTPANN